MCVSDNKPYWKANVKEKYKERKVYFTRYMSNLGLNAIAKTKGPLWYNHKFKKYMPKSAWYNGKDPGIAPV